ncbi:unnamed protein product [Diatraea saccharalis]|uniref:Uncharacterized protein n=1 Tax=Diatraea saccharalis TaxID=40085 RepID=A0A9N9RGV8_9NEOP|nr:unnamed protein product [Diatraea saccharalis]
MKQYGFFRISTRMEKQCEILQSIQKQIELQGSSNGTAEATLKSAKKLILKCYETGEDFWILLLHQRNFSNNEDHCSPAQKFLSRRTRTFLPSTSEQMVPVRINNIPENLMIRKEKSKYFYDK